MTRGLTLIELIITITLAAIIAISTGILLSEHLTGALRARDYAVGMSLARAEMERLDSLTPISGQENTTGVCAPDLNLTSATPPPINGYWPGYPYALTRIVLCQAGDCSLNCDSSSGPHTGIKRITVQVTKSGSGELVASLVSYRTKFVRFGS